MTDSFVGRSVRTDVAASRGPAAPARPLLLGWSSHWPMIVVGCTAVLTGVVGGRAISPADTGPLLAVLAGYLVADRWGCWRWLTALGTVPVLFGAVRAVDLDSWGAFALATAGAAVAVLGWQARTQPVAWVPGGVLLAAAVVLAWQAEPIEGDSFLGHPALIVVLGLCLAFSAAALAGLGRSMNRSLQLVCLLLLVSPAAMLPAPGHPFLLALAFWPMAAAVGITALLRGGRGEGARLPQVDEVDEAVMAEFEARHGAGALGPVTIVIAAYNEAAGLPQVLASLPTEVCGLPADVLVVDDGSSDGTSEALAGSAAHVASCPVNRGQGAALRLGYRLARRHGARYILTTDADGQYDVADFPVVLAPILAGQADFVSGSRVLGHQHTFDRVRRTGVHVFAWLATFLTGQRLTDTSFGLRAMRAEVTAAVTLNQPQYQSSELLLGVISHGFRVLEVPGTMHVRSAGTTKKGRNLTYGSNYAKVMTTTWWREGAPRPVAECAPALRTQSGTTATPSTD